MRELRLAFDETIMVPVVTGENSDSWAESTGASLVPFAASTRALSVLRIAVVEDELAPDERSAFLLPDAAIRPQVRLTPEASIGVGVSSTILVDPSTGESEVRWMFLPKVATVLARLDPASSTGRRLGTRPGDQRDRVVAGLQAALGALELSGLVSAQDAEHARTRSLDLLGISMAPRPDTTRSLDRI
ncbi:MAG: hypothetical protein QM630_09110 [Microbacterium sp.]